MAIGKLSILLSDNSNPLIYSEEYIQEKTGVNPQIVKTNGLDGQEAAWIIIATLTVQALPSVLTFLKEMLKEEKVSKIKYRDFEIQDPSQDFANRIEQMIIEDIEDVEIKKN